MCLPHLLNPLLIRAPLLTTILKVKKTFNGDLLIKLGWQPGILQPGLLLRRKFPNLGKFESKTHERGYFGGSDQSDEIKRNKKTHKIIKK